MQQQENERIHSRSELVGSNVSAELASSNDGKSGRRKNTIDQPWLTSTPYTARSESVLITRKSPALLTDDQERLLLRVAASNAQKNAVSCNVRSRKLQNSLKQATSGILTASSKTSSISRDSALQNDGSGSSINLTKNAEESRDEETSTLSDSSSLDDSPDFLRKFTNGVGDGCRYSNSEPHETDSIGVKKVARILAGPQHRAPIVGNELLEVGQGFMSHCSKTLYYIGIFFKTPINITCIAFKTMLPILSALIAICGLTIVVILLILNMWVIGYAFASKSPLAVFCNLSLPSILRGSFCSDFDRRIGNLSSSGGPKIIEDFGMTNTYFRQMLFNN